MKFKSRFLSIVMASALMLSSFVENASALEDTPSAKPVTIENRNASRVIDYNSLKPKTGKQKVLLVMVEFPTQRFKRVATEEYFHNQLFGEEKYSLKSYLRDQSDGRVKIYPAEVKNAKYPGVIKIKMDASRYGTVRSRDYDTHMRIAKDAFRMVQDQVEWDKIDTNGDKSFREAYQIDNDSLIEEFLPIFIFSGDEQGTRIESHVHMSEFITSASGYSFDVSAMISSASSYGRVIGSPELAHEFLHDFNARDMYLDKESIGMWSVMSLHLGQNHLDYNYAPTPVDPYHKLYFKWAKPVKVKLSSTKPVTIKYNKREVPYIEDPRDSNVIYLLDYRDHNNYYVRSLDYYGMKSSGMVVWKVNKREAQRDWLSTTNGYWDWYVNSAGPKTAVSVMSRGEGEMSIKDSFAVDGKERSIDGTLIKVKPHKGSMTVYYRGAK